MNWIVRSDWLPERSRCRPFQPDWLYTLENNYKKERNLIEKEYDTGLEILPSLFTPRSTKHGPILTSASHTCSFKTSVYRSVSATRRVVVSCWLHNTAVVKIKERKKNQIIREGNFMLHSLHYLESESSQGSWINKSINTQINLQTSSLI